jgi:hypothetical protein
MAISSPINCMLAFMESHGKGSIKETRPQRKRDIRGARGARGPVGLTGPAGPKMKPAEVLVLVDDQFAEIRKQFFLQLQRTAQLQVQLDKILGRTNDACSTLDMLHDLLKQLVKEDSVSSCVIRCVMRLAG